MINVPAGTAQFFDVPRQGTNLRQHPRGPGTAGTGTGFRPPVYPSRKPLPVSDHQ